MGYIELRDGRARFTRVADPARPVALVTLPLAAVALAVIATVNLGRLTRRS